MSESCYRDLMLPTPKQVYNIDVKMIFRLLVGNKLKTIGITVMCILTRKTTLYIQFFSL